jgi:glycyl-tRNA synthetase beta subunit
MLDGDWSSDVCSSDLFDRVTVNADVTAVRQNRLSLLSAVAGSMDRVADFSQIEG